MRSRTDVVEGVAGNQRQPRLLGRLQDANRVGVDDLVRDDAVSGRRSRRSLEVDLGPLAERTETAEVRIPVARDDAVVAVGFFSGQLRSGHVAGTLTQRRRIDPSED